MRIAFFLVYLILFFTAPSYGQDSCKGCHKGIEPILDRPPMRDLPCEFCHQGDPEESNKDLAHKYLIKNPSDFRVADRTCGVCHYDILLAAKKSLHSTSAGIISGARWAWAAQDTKNALYATYDIKDTDKEVPKGLGALEFLRKLPSYSPSKPISDNNHPVDDYLRSECLRCHLWTRGIERYGDYRASGCAACHMIYDDDGLYKGGDKAMDRRSPGRPRLHTVTSKIPPFQCLHCHNRGDRIGTSYVGMMESDGYGAPWGTNPGEKGGQRLHGKYYNHLVPDIHYERGMACIDCHTSRDIHGDGNIYSKKEQAVEIECVDCHGTPWKRSDYTTSRGRRIPWMWEDKGKILLKGKLDGKIHVVPQLVDLSQGGSERAKVAMGIEGHMKRLECYACHGVWAPQCYGCHVQQDLGEKAPDWVENKRPDDPSKAGEEANLVKDTFKWRETRSFLRWEDPVLGTNAEGLVAPYIPGCQVIFTQVGPGVDEKFKSYVFRTKDDTSGISSNPVQPHTTRKEARSCASCHMNRKALGLGTPFFISRQNGIPVDFFMDQIVDDQGKQLQSTSHVGARPFNKVELQRISRVTTCIGCHRFMRSPSKWEAIKKRLGSAETDRIHKEMMGRLLER